MAIEEIQTVERQSTALAVRAAGLVVVDQVSADRASEIVTVGKEMVRRIKSFFAPLKDAARKSWQGIVDQEKLELGKVEPVVEKVSNSLASWRAAEDRKRREVEEARRRQEAELRRLEEEAVRKAQEEERRAAEEKRRIEEDARRRELEAQRQAQQAKNAEARRKAEEEAARIRKEAEARKAEEDRRAREAQDAIIERAAAQEDSFNPVPVVPEKARTDGLLTRTYWKAEVVDAKALLQAVLAGTVSPEAIEPNMPYLNDLAGKVKDQVAIPGVRVYSEIKMVQVGMRAHRA